MQPFLGEIRAFPFTFAPRGWALCDGSLISIQQNTALFSLLGTYYGGDGRTTFGLPDLRGRAAIGVGQGTGLSPYVQGQQAGFESVTLQPNQIAAHTHALPNAALPVSAAAATSTSPQGNYYAVSSSEQYGETSTNGATANVLGGNTAATGASQPHENRMPYLAIGYYIATQGIFPSRQ